MKQWEQAYEDWLGGMKYKEIASKYGVSEGTVKSWASRYFKTKKAEEVATSKKKKLQPKSKGLQPPKPKKRGAPKGNTNATGNNGGAPPRNQNHFKHGIYSKVYWDTLDDEERQMLEDMDYDEEQLLEEQIALLTIRERRLMKQIGKYMTAKGGQAVSSLTRFEHKREFANDDEKELYEERQRVKVESGDKLPGRDYSLSTTMEATYNIIQRFESELTRVQARKTRCIEALKALREEKQGEKGNELVNDWIYGVMDGDIEDGE